MRSTLSNLIIAGAAAWLLLPAGCRTPTPDGASREPDYRNWWNYYARGLASLQAGSPQAAQEDFERCLGVRDGARFADDQDRWRARTYGMHYVDGYFPNRELGIAWYEAHDLTNALRWLERSYRQTPSDRATHYLNLIRRHEARASRPEPPWITWDASVPLLTNERSVLLRGVVQAPGYAGRLTVGGVPYPVDLAQNRLAFTVRVPLRDGRNGIPAEATDLAGQRGVATHACLADWQPPLLAIHRLQREADGRWQVAGVCHDNHAVASLRVGAEELARPAGTNRANWAFDVRVRPLETVFTARDQAGNVLQTRLDLEDLSALAPLLQHAGRLALTGGSGGSDAPATRLAPPAPPAPADDRLAPSLQINNTREVCVVAEEEFYLDGTAADNGGLHTIRINGEELLTEADRGALRSCFARRIPLHPGTNRVTLVVSDRAGNQTVREALVIRRIPEYQHPATRLAVGLPPLLPEDAGTMGVRAKRGLESALLREPIRFRLLERDEGWNKILQEQMLSISDLADPRAALPIGRIVPADLLLMGRILTEPRGLTLYVKAVDTASGEVLFDADVYSAEPEKNLEADADNLILKFKQGFPLLSGTVLRREGARVTLGIGTKDGAVTGSRFVVMRGAAGSTNAVGALRRHGDRPVQLVLERVESATAAARIVPAEASDAIQEVDHVYAR
jgi:tetratricopeptide (TPR) repeat protein